MKMTLKDTENQHRRKSILEHLQTECAVHFQYHGKHPDLPADDISSSRSVRFQKWEIETENKTRNSKHAFFIGEACPYQNG